MQVRLVRLAIIDFVQTGSSKFIRSSYIDCLYLVITLLLSLLAQLKLYIGSTLNDIALPTVPRTLDILQKPSHIYIGAVINMFTLPTNFS